jgi:hypothetical protein
MAQAGSWVRRTVSGKGLLFFFQKIIFFKFFLKILCRLLCSLAVGKGYF